ncbi:MAG: DUF5009 domain-containing protein [Planctomycetes bacterium]|nr:DUF5009 domain-containing protein [Planctomycetota bacterium]
MNPPRLDQPEPQRVVALDVFRGATILTMILVNNPGSWSHVFAPLRHAEWHGWTPTDLVFPFFLFIVGVAIALSLGRRVEGGVSRSVIVRQILRRGLVLFGLGIFLNMFPFVADFETFQLKSVATLRIPGVLQRIAICYVVVGLLTLWLRARTLGYVTVACLGGYWALMTLVPLPGGLEPDLSIPDQNLAAVIDRFLLGSHLWSGTRTWDPEGILSTIPALATTLFGVSVGRLLRSSTTRSEQVTHLFVRGSLLVVLGYVFDWFFPINKGIWTSSYAVFTAGQAMCALALAMWFVDVCGYRRALRPFIAYGVNPITVFVMSGVVGRLMTTIRVATESGKSIALKTWIYEACYTSWITIPKLASLAFALTWVVGWYCVLSWMLRRNLIVKV